MSVSILMVKALIEAVGRAGVSQDQLLDAVGISPSELEEVDARISFIDFFRAQMAALELTGDEALGLHLGEQAKGVSYHLLGHLYEHAATLRESIESALQYQSLLSDAPESMLCEEGEVATIRYDFPLIDSPSIRMGAELAMCGHWLNICLFIGPEVKPRAVFFSYPAPSYLAEYRRIFGGAERFDHGFTGISFDRAWLDRPRFYKNPELYSALKEQAERALNKIKRNGSQADAVLNYLLSCDPMLMPSMGQVARHFGASDRTLRRRLAAEGVLFSDLVRKAMMSIARRMLESSIASINEISFAMGFATPSSFHRAFKRWTGMTPSEYRTSCRDKSC